MGVDHYENFPVASVLCPPRLRAPIAAIYWFARTADDIADEGNAGPAQRLAELTAYRAELRATLEHGLPAGRWPQVFGPLAAAHGRHHLPMALLSDLLSAFEQDVHNPIYRDRAELMDYCRRSADPVGRLLLHLYGIQGAAQLRRSDAICSALQLVNFWQDLGKDHARGRSYLPQSDLLAHGLPTTAPCTLPDSPALRALVAELCRWARQLMLEGAPLAFDVPGRAGWELRLVVQGGLRILEKIEALDHATALQRPTLRATDLPLLLWRALRMSRSPAA
ncbi:MAG: squalene synthase HpnC [Rubrivivax sp.]|nr:squalene synthase HpnC [Rubrivivax sp.]